MHEGHQQHQQPQPFGDMRKSVNILLFCAQVVSAPLRAWLTVPGTWGARFVDWRFALGVAVQILAPPLFFPRSDGRPLVAFWVATLVMLLVQRVAGVWRRRRGYVTHSQYTGKPWMPGNEIAAKGTKEPALCFCVGVIVLGPCPALGGWLIAASFAQACCVAWNETRDAARLRSLRDAEIEHRYLMERFREEVDE